MVRRTAQSQVTWGEALKEALGFIAAFLLFLAACAAVVGVVAGGPMLFFWVGEHCGWPIAFASGAFLILTAITAGIKAGL